ncbi:hypothetical protein BJ322DRAFT_1021595 [Thelephora terrestris]|uniref:Uncharacterized protein n=1 Tax=Thelephora terrestris TaxID=56493 RepID=A0A9P6HBR9_9AGAM|nr:hypothetical protein BJ322DRAFT_1021595 [Thelephora terrestris]
MNTAYSSMPLDKFESVAFRKPFPDRETEWYPYESKTMFLLDTLDSMPRLHVSDSLMKVFLWVLKESGVQSVPSFRQLRDTQAKLCETSGTPSKLYKSAHGNLFYMNDIRKIITNDYANPLVCPHIRIYPETPDGPITEIWHAEKWRKEMDLGLLSPMYADGARHYYVLEFACLKNGDFVVPAWWLTYKGRVKADVFQVKKFPDGTVSIDGSQTAQIDACEFQDTYPELMDQGLVPEIAQKPGKNIGTPMLPIATFPESYCSKNFTSIFYPQVPMPQSLNSCKHLLILLIALPSFNHAEGIHMQTQSLSMMPALMGWLRSHRRKGKFSLSKCKARGTMLEKETDERYHKLFMPGEPRCSCEIVESLQRQLKLACSGIKARVLKEQSTTGIKDSYTQYWIDQLLERAQTMKNEGTAVAEIEQELSNWVDENQSLTTNKIFTLKGFDPTQDSPIEILHTILLGIVKYNWHFSHTKWTTEQKKKYAVQLQSTNIDGLNIPPIRAGYIMQYAGSFIGRQFKSIIQTNTFHTHNICDPYTFYLWKAIGELTALLWMPEIDNLEQYLDDVNIAASNVLDGFMLIDPTKMISKVKLHILGHLWADIRRFGPMVGSATSLMPEPAAGVWNGEHINQMRQSIMDHFQCSEEEASTRLQATLDGAVQTLLQDPPPPPQNPPTPPPNPPAEIAQNTTDENNDSDFDDDAMVGDNIPLNLLVFATKKLDAKEYVDLWYFTMEGCREAS